jgi:quercetin dioxygenase-like cupin family protein
VIIAGAGTVRLEDGEHTLEPGDVLSIAPNEPHAILGRGPGTLRFVCMDSLTG